MHFSSTYIATALLSLVSGAVLGKRSLSGEATFYGGNVAGGTCSFSTYAVPSGLYGPAGNAITAMIVDECPGCGTNHLDLFPNAFAELANPSTGIIDVTWSYVDCPITSPLQLHNKDGVSAYWFSMQVVNANKGVATLEVSTDGGSTWQATERQTYNFFEASNGFGTTTLDIRVSSVDGDIVIVNNLGVLMTPYQTIDVAGPLDILSTCSKALQGPMEAGSIPGSAGLTEKAIDIIFHHVNETLDPVTLTAGFQVQPSTTCDTCPPLDILLVGGSDPAYQLSERFQQFVRTHVESGKLLFTTCTGALAISPSGILDGRHATTNHVLLEMAKQVRPDVKWTGEKQWVVDGNLWTAGGASAGMDMIAHWVIENYDIEVAAFGLSLLDFEPRDINGVANVVLPKQHALKA
ncbi:hypothetical protein B7494_g7241 [Chlorociboria aeruginascens]|nr:hypothetical protein B7494_g7241 [Chlorociboria aeruginascens]